MNEDIVFYLNGQLCEVSKNHSMLMLSDYLRYEQCLTGTKVVCAEGDCGACTVLKYNPLLKGGDAQNFLPINSCIMPVACLHGSHILTVESLKLKDKLHQAQNSLIEAHGSQCGFCTPGFAMALAGLCEEKIDKKDFSISEKETKNCLTGNLCRCTGYQSIIKAGKNGFIKYLKKLQEISIEYYLETLKKLSLALMRKRFSFV